MSSFFCTKCGWHRRPRDTDPKSVMCGNPSCNYVVTRTKMSKKEVRESLALNLQELCAWSKEYAKGFVDGAGMVEDNALANCSGILEKLVEAKMLKTKLANENMTTDEFKLVVVQYKKLRDEGWAKAFEWFGWDVEVDGFPPATMLQGKEVDKLPPEEEAKLKHFPKEKN